MKFISFLFLILILVLTAKFREAAECGNNPLTCPPNTIKWRTFDGTCNNLNNPGWGSLDKPYARWIKPPNYSDGISRKALSASGDPLPNARQISEIVAAEIPDISSKKVRFIGAWHQFPAHDHSLTKFLSFAPCCTKDFKPLVNTPLTCDNIDIPSNDSFYSQFSATCMPKFKTATTLDLSCSGSPPETFADQLSAVTPALDLNIVYSNSKAASDNLREFNLGRMKVRKVSNVEYLPTGGIGCAVPPNNPNICYATGDIRANQNPDLTIKHIMWLRFHNWCCRIMAPINPHWDDERMFQECRKINIAVYQFLTFHYAFTAVLGANNMRGSNLIWPYKSPNTSRIAYDNSCQLNPLNEFSSGAYRVLHAIIIACLRLANEDRYSLGDIKLMDHINYAAVLEKNDNLDNLVRGGTSQKARKVSQSHDSHFTTRFSFVVTDYKFALDIMAFDIDRAREHGIPSYNTIRVKCGLRRATTFNDLLDVMTSKSLDNIKKVYQNVNDIDYVVGAMSEKPVPDALVGPTVKCVMLEALQRIQRCDRFWFDNTENNFNDQQLNSIRSMTISSFLCLNGDSLAFMQKDAFDPPSLLNPILPCVLQPPMSLNPWKENPLI